MKISLFFCLLLFSIKSEAQVNLKPIKLEEAVELSIENQVLLESKKLQIDQAEAMKASAWDFGETQLFTGGEELGNVNPGVYTRIGVKQQGIDVFGIAPKNKFYKQKTELAEANYQLFELQWERKVKTAWTDAFIAKQKLDILIELDSIYGKFVKAAKLKYEVESISELEFLSAQNKAGEITIRKNQAQSNYQVALENLNLLIGGDTQYSVPDELPPGLFPDEDFYPEKLKNHPLLTIQQKETEVAEARKKVARAEFLPELSLQYGLQEIDGMDGFYNYEIGISVPVFSGENYAASKSAKIGQQIAEKETKFARKQLQATYRKAVENFQKWKQSWEYFQQEILPNIKKQRSGSLLAYREGALDYFALIQNLDASISSEFRALESLEHYLFAIFNLQFYIINP